MDERAEERHVFSSMNTKLIRNISFSIFMGLGSGAWAEEAATAEKAEMEKGEMAEKEGEWIQLFNGKDLEDWTPKFQRFEAGVNFRDTFRVEDGLLSVNYDQWENFEGQFGHLLYNQPFSHYRLRATYRFVGEQVPGGPKWAERNNGLMLHCDKAEEIPVGKMTPTCIEAQLLGGNGTDERSTLNIVPLGVQITWKGEEITRGVQKAGGPTFHGDQWVTAEVEVRGDQIKHIIDGEVVCEYTVQNKDGTPRTSGYIAVQAETGPTQFKSIELLPLEK